MIPLYHKLETEQLTESAIRRAIGQLRDPGLGLIVSGPTETRRYEYRFEWEIVQEASSGGIQIPTEGNTEIAHCLSHAGIESVQFMKKRFFWFKMGKMVEDYCLFCVVYLENKRRNRKREPLQPMQLNLKEPRVDIAMDIATLPWSSGGHPYMLSIIELFS